MLEPIKEMKLTRVNSGSVAGTSAVNSTSVDMQGFNSVSFIVELGTVTATGLGTAVVAQSDDNSSFTNCETPAASWSDTSGGKTLILTVVAPTHRYYRCSLARTVANSVVDSILAIQTEGIAEPVTQSASVVATSLVVGG